MPKTTIPLRRSLRTKLVLVSIVIEIIMLGILLGNSLRLLNETLEQQTQARLEELSPLLNAALSSRMFERDQVTITEIIDQLLSSPSGGFRYIVVYDDRDAVYAKAGDIDTDRMPARDERVASSLLDRVYDQVTPLTLSNEKLGKVRFGLSIESFLASRDNIITQGLLIASTEVVLTFLLLSIAGYLLTRHIINLTEATRVISAGDYSRRVTTTTRDEIGLLARNFNKMSEAIGDRVRALHQSEQALFNEKERAEVTLHSIGDAVITTDVGGNTEYLNPVAETLTGWSTVEAAGKPLEQVFRISHETSQNQIENPVQRCLREQKIVILQNHTVLTDRHGKSYPIEDSAAPIRDRSGAVIGAVLVFHDVSKARRLSHQLQYQATHDPLTGLFNRREFERQLDLALEDARLVGNEHALCYLDLDQFKVVNDTCGHIAGDELLRQLGSALKQKVRDSDVLARLGGDEFGLLIMNCPFERLRVIADAVRDAIREYHFVWEKQSFQIGVSVGVVPIKADSSDISEVLAAADVACYLAKDQGRNCVRFYENDDQEHAQRRGEMQWSSRINMALHEQRFRLYYQKIFPIAEQATPLLDCELLVRMLDEKGKTVSPGIFIPAAERYHHMVDVDRWVIHTAFNSPDIKGPAASVNSFSINLSGQSLCAEDFLDYVLQEIDSSGIRPQRICFEITETTAIANLTHARQFISRLREKGCMFALDDFGSGLSSFAYLKNLPVDFLKIDGSFVRDIIEDQADRAIVEAINQVGHALGIKTIAEFIEDFAVQQKLLEMGVDYGQGFAIHKPAPLSTSSHPISAGE